MRSHSISSCNVVLPLMSKGGRIIALSSLGAQRAIPMYGFVAASKAALESLVRSLAAELGPRGICVNAVSPGLVDTDALRAFPNREATTRRILPSAHQSRARYRRIILREPCIFSAFPRRT